MERYTQKDRGTRDDDFEHDRDTQEPLYDRERDREQSRHAYGDYPEAGFGPREARYGRDRIANRERTGERLNAGVLDRSAIAPISRGGNAYDRAVREALAREKAEAVSANGKRAR